MVCVALNEQGFCYPSCGDQDQDYCAETYGSAFSCNVNDDVDGTYVYTCSTPQ